jgi:FG-GAP-like repeat/FG-GAP repeat
MITPIRSFKNADSIRRRLRRVPPPTVFSGTIFRLRPRLEVMEDRTLLSTFLVSNTGDSGPGSLRQAILDSNSNNAVGATNSIDFDIPGTGVQTIVPLSSLPAIANPVLIDGFSQPGYSSTPLIEINGNQAGGGDGLTITGAGMTVRGLDIDSFSQGAGIHVTGTGATGDWIYGNFLGTDPTGTQAESNDYGVEIDGGAANNLIGTNGDGVNDAAEQNLISGNSFAGIWINGQGADGNAVAGNFIGTSVTGDVALDNGTSGVVYSGVETGGGVVIEGGASGNRIGADGSSVDDAGQRNVIAGGAFFAAVIEIIGAGTDGNIVAGNFIGTDVTGARSFYAYYQDGVEIAGGASANWVGVNPDGGAAVGDEGNVISGTSDGVQIYEADDNVVAGNKIGTDATGAVALGNAQDGVEIDASSGNTIGGTGAGGADVISGNFSAGVELDGSSDNLVEGNFIGTDATGTKALGNVQEGVEIDATDYGPSTHNTIGGTSAIASNLITDNGGPGVVITGYSSVGNQITANRIFGNTGQAIDLGDDGATENATAPRQGPNNLQNFPIIVTTADGQTEGWLGGSESDTTYRIDVFASAAYNADGSGEAQDYLGSLEVTTDATGQVTFAVPFTAPSRLPDITATATDPQGNTSEVSALRRATLQAPSLALRTVPNQSLAFATKSGDGIVIQDPDAGPLKPVWSLTLSVSVGTLTLSSTAGVTGSGDGTGSLSYSGPLSSLNAALEGMTFNPPSDPHVFAILTLGAQSSGAPPLQTQFAITADRVLLITTTADSGPGSLRQAILDSNVATGGTNTIDFAIPGTVVQTIAPVSPLPAITNPVVIDGTTQPGYAGAPLIVIVGQGTGDADPLTVGSDVTVKGLAVGGSSFSSVSSSTMLAAESVPLSQAQGGTVTYQIVVAAGEDLVATAQAVGATTSLSLLDAQGQVVMQSDGLSAADPIDAIDAYIAAGAYALQVHDTGGNGSFTLTAMMMPSAPPFQPIPVGDSPDAIEAGDFNGDGKLDLAVSNNSSDTVSILLGNGDGTFQPAVDYSVGTNPRAIVAGDFNGNGRLDLAVANEGDANVSGNVSILLGNGDGTFQPAVDYSVGNGPDAIAVGDFNGDGRLDLAVANKGVVAVPGTVSILMGNGDGTFQPAVDYTVGNWPDAIVVGDFSGDGKLDLAVANFAYSSNNVSILMGNGDGTFQPAVDYTVGNNPGAIVAGDFNGDGRLDLDRQTVVEIPRS